MEWKIIPRIHNIKRIGLIFIINLVIWISFGIPIPIVRAQTQITFPDSILKIQSANYTISQRLTHWNKGVYVGSGTDDMNFSIPYAVSAPDIIQIDENNSVNLWQRPCDYPANYTGETSLLINSTNRYILRNPTMIGDVDQSGYYTNHFLGDTLSGNYPKAILLEDLIYILGVTLQETFVFGGYELVNYNNQLINCSKMIWSGQALYAGYLCSIGEAPLMNLTFEYYYELQTGLMIFSHSIIEEYISNNTAIYQIHDITKSLQAFSYIGQPSTSNSNGNLFIEFFNDQSNSAERNAFFGSLAIIGVGVITIIWVHKVATRRRVKQLLDEEDAKLFQKSSDPESE